ARVGGPPDYLAVGRVQALQGARRTNEELRFALHLDKHRRAVAEGHVGPFLLPFDVAGLLVEGDQTRMLRLGTVGLYQNRILKEDRTGADGDVPGVGLDGLAPDLLAVEVESDQLGGAEQDVDAFAVGARGRSAVTAAQVFQEPGAGRHLDVPEQLAVLGAVT